MKLGVCIPYRDNGDGVRQSHLDRLIPHLEEFLGKQGIDFTCYVGHQIDYEKFHRSGTKNIAYLQAKKDGCDYFAFHDVDMLPYDDCYYGHQEFTKTYRNLVITMGLYFTRYRILRWCSDIHG